MKINRPHSRWLIAVALVSTVAGCTLGPDYVRPDPRLPAEFDSKDRPVTSIARPDWWGQYKDTQLNDLVAAALIDNADVAAAVARIEQADAVARQAGAAILPEIDLNGSGTRSRISSQGTIPVTPAFGSVRNDFRATLGTTFEIDLWGKLRRTQEAARAQALSSRYARDTVFLTMAGLVVRNYLTLRSMDKQIAALESTLSADDQTLALVQRRARGGVASGLEVEQAQSARAAIAAQIPELRQQRALAEHQLQFLTGNLALKIVPQADTPLPNVPYPPVGLPSELLESRPDIRQAEAQLVAANARIGVAKAALFPTISLTGDYGGESRQLSNLLSSGARLWSLGLGLALPIFDAGRRVAQLDQTTAQQKEALANYIKAVRSAFTDVNDILVTQRETAQAGVALEAQLRAARRALSLARLRYREGYSGFLEVLDAQRTENVAWIALLRNQQSQLLASVGVFNALGGGWSSVNAASVVTQPPAGGGSTMPLPTTAAPPSTASPIAPGVAPQTVAPYAPMPVTQPPGMPAVDPVAPTIVP